MQPSLDVSKKNPTALDTAMQNTYKNTRDFMMVSAPLYSQQQIDISCMDNQSIEAATQANSGPKNRCRSDICCIIATAGSHSRLDSTDLVKMVLDHEPACCNYVPPRQPTCLIMWLMPTVLMQTAFNLTEDEVISAITVGVDFGVAQVRPGWLSSWPAVRMIQMHHGRMVPPQSPSSLCASRHTPTCPEAPATLGCLSQHKDQ